MVDSKKIHRGKRIADAIKQSGKSQNQIAKIVGVTPQSITKWIKTGNIYMDNLLSLADVTGVDVRYLISGVGSWQVDGSEESPKIAEKRGVYQAQQQTKHLGLHKLVDQLDDEQARRFSVLAKTLLDSGEAAMSVKVSIDGKTL